MQDQDTIARPAVGQRCNRLTAKEIFKENCRKYVFCQCDCGCPHVVRADQFVEGSAYSCGCVSRIRTHGMSRPDRRSASGYSAWKAMRRRCYDKTHDTYHRYGGRGITVCERWRESFEAFIADIGSRPSLLHTIEREDNDGPYEPGNCKWDTRTAQARNRSSNLRLSVDGVSRCAAEWAQDLQMHTSSLTVWVQRHSAEQFPKYYKMKLAQVQSGAPKREFLLVQRRRGHVCILSAFGRKQCIADWAREFGLKPKSLTMWIRRNGTANLDQYLLSKLSS